mgnify:CR=1 FL=1
MTKKTFLHSDFLVASLGAICLSAFLYLPYLSLSHFISMSLHTVLAVIGFFILITGNRRVLFVLGFFVGILWFYWISLSLRYYGLAYLIPFGVIGIALLYAGWFWVLGWLPIPLRFVGIFALEYIHIFDFHYLNLKLPLVSSLFGASDLVFILLLLLLTLFVYPKRVPYPAIENIIGQAICATVLIVLVWAQYGLPESIKPPLTKAPLDIKLIHGTTSQDEKWQIDIFRKQLQKYYTQIEQAIKEKRDAIVFPESTFEVPLNLYPTIENKLLEYSHKITIIAGSLYITENEKHNSTYIFTSGNRQVAHKYILTPFGERVPLPAFAVKWINELFYEGSSDFLAAPSYSTYTIQGISFTNAICYEATSAKLYKHRPKYMIALSNNAWFTPSIQPILQHTYLKYLSKKYNTVIYHSTNLGKTEVIF